MMRYSVKNLLAVLAVSLCLPVSGALAQGGAPVKALLKNGMPVVAQAYDGDLAAACVFVKAGTAFETPENSGITELLNRTLLSCDPLRAVSPPVMKIERLGAKVSVETGSDFSCFRLVAPNRNFGAALKVLSDVFRKQECAEAALSMEKESMAAARRKLEDRPEERAYALYLEKAYGGLPLGREGLGTDASVAGLRLDDLKLWQSAYYRPGGMLVSIAAKMPPESAVKLAERAFSGFNPAGEPARNTRPDVNKISKGGVHNSYAGGGRAAAVVGYGFPAPGSPDYAACVVAHAMLSYGMGSLLFKAMRDSRDIAYNFGSYAPESDIAPHLVLYGVTDAARVDAAVGAMKSSVESLISGGFGKEDLDRAKGAAIGQIAMRRETALDSAWSAGMGEILGIGWDFSPRLIKQLEKIEKPDIVRAAGRYFDTPTAMVVRPGR